MSKLDEKVGQYIDEVRGTLGLEPDVDLIRKVAEGLGPSIHNADASRVAASDPKEVETVKRNFLMGKLGLDDSDDLDRRLKKVMDMYAEKSRTKYRAVVYYLLTKEFGKDSVYDS
ncbi:DUF2853 family protein [uncultured Algimonas sp.]|uniref:DUF2853 family protein n=1 Tax=uncultured Algimonas sp. TaxID=1547920 RepID=UPI002626C2CA|nr:DUF2853 family protein [uncultured Algimonas sp.]